MSLKCFIHLLNKAGMEYVMLNKMNSMREVKVNKTYNDSCILIFTFILFRWFIV